MAARTKIEWTRDADGNAGATWNPITGCTIKSPGCTNCYAMKLAGTRLYDHPSRKGLTKMSKSGPVWTGEVRFNEQWLDQPMHWRKPRMIFVCAHGDLFAPGVKRHWQGACFEVMRDANQHIYQVLTKRQDEMLAFIEACNRNEEIATWLGPWPMPHVWLGCSIEDQARADERREPMRRLAELGWLTWVSYEPALEVVDWTGWEFLRWMVSGGESDTDGKSARPSPIQAHRGARDFCASHDIAYHFKQHGAHYPERLIERGKSGEVWREGPDGRCHWYVDEIGTADPPEHRFVRVGKKRAGRLLDGREHNEFPRPA